MKQFTKQEKEDITKNYLTNYSIQELDSFKEKFHKFTAAHSR